MLLAKDRRRAIRRWRSRTKFMRRLRADWNDHGWRRDPAPAWYGRGGDNWDGTRLCPCFYDPKAQARFKESPHAVCDRDCNPREYAHGDEAYTRQELIADLPEEDWHKRKRRIGLVVRRHRCCTTCGRTIAWDRHVVGRWEASGPRTCEECQKKMRM